MSAFSSKHQGGDEAKPRGPRRREQTICHGTPCQNIHHLETLSRRANARKISWHVKAIVCSASFVCFALVLVAFRERTRLNPTSSAPSLSSPSSPSAAQNEADEAATTTSLRSGWVARREESVEAPSSAATAAAGAAAAPTTEAAAATAAVPVAAQAPSGSTADAPLPPTTAALAPAAAVPPPARPVKPPEYGSIEVKNITKEVAVDEKTCFQVRVMDTEGRPFDQQSGEREEGGETFRKGVDWRVEHSQGHLHRAFLVARAVYERKLPVGADGGGEGDRGYGWEDGDLKKEVSTVFAPRVRFLRLSSLHEVCYTPPRPGRLVLELILLFTNTYELVSSAEPTHPKGYAGPRTVLTLNVTVRAPVSYQNKSDHLPSDADRWLSNRRSLPWCTLPILDRSQGEGFWEGALWHPARCRALRPSIDSLLSCLNGRNILFLGDSQVRAVFGFLLSYLSYESRGVFFKSMGKEGWGHADFFYSMKELRVNGSAEQRGNGSAAKDPQVRRVAMHVNGSVWRAEIGEQGRPFEAELCGLSFNGSTLANLETRVGGTVVSVSLTYVRHEDHRMSAVRHWMALRSECSKSGGMRSLREGKGEGGRGNKTDEPEGRNRTRDGRGSGDEAHRHGKVEGFGESGPFDFAVVARQLHDMLRFELPEEYAGWLASKFEPEMRGLVHGGDMGRVLLLGGPASQEGKNAEGAVPLTNRARQFAFERAAERAILGQDPTEDELRGYRGNPREVRLGEDKGRPQGKRCELAEEVGTNQTGSAHVLRLGPLTAPRPDFCTNGLHYAWPVDLAVLDLLFGSICCSSKPN